MMLTIDEDTVLEFKRVLNFETKEPTDELTALLKVDGAEYDVVFNETIFKDWRNNEIKINQECISWAVKNFKTDLSNLISKSTKVLTCLHEAIFKNEYHEKSGYFDLLGMEITKYRSHHKLIFFYEIDLIFSLESKSDFLMDPYFFYCATFNSSGNAIYTLAGVRREEK